jgi:hypothetical protein
MFRVWSEHLPFDVARSKDVLDLLVQGPLHPLFAVAPGADLDELARVLEMTGKLGLEAGIWPLLRDEDGYWPSERNAPAYFEYVEGLLDFFEGAGVMPAWLAVDLEPPLYQVSDLRYDLRSLDELVSNLRENFDPVRFSDSVRGYTEGLHALRARGLRALAVTLPMAAHDLRDGTPLWQDLFEAPWSPVPWDRAGIMAYGSMVSGYSRGLLSYEDARAVHYRLFRHLARALGARAHASLGVTGIGKLGDEPTYENPDELAQDVSAALAAGVEDIAIFCLEGLAGREDAGAWVDAITNAKPRKPYMTLRAGGLRMGAAAARFLLRQWRGA